MKSFTKYLWFNTKKKRDFLHITHDIEELVQESKVQEGFCLVSAMHITASVYVNDNETGLLEDMTEWLEGLAPENPDYKHHLTGEDNGDAHLKRMILGHQVILPITEGSLDLGPWEAVFYAEFDGRRKKRVVVKIIGE
jgi:secondary thiamine-phosphate synthase enzyme